MTLFKLYVIFFFIIIITYKFPQKTPEASYQKVDKVLFGFWLYSSAPDSLCEIKCFTLHLFFSHTAPQMGLLFHVLLLYCPPFTLPSILKDHRLLTEIIKCFIFYQLRNLNCK